MIRFLAVVAVSGCAAKADLDAPSDNVPEPFGVTMVEETTCIGQGGRIVMGPNGAYCREEVQ